MERLTLGLRRTSLCAAAEAERQADESLGAPMSVGYILVNFSVREMVSFVHVDASSLRELAGSPAAAAITTWYLLHHLGDQIAFVSDTYDDWPFPGSKADLASFPDATDRTISDLILAGILADRGRVFVDEDDPEHVYVRDLRNVWFEAPADAARMTRRSQE
ncbi:hypothetical protein [Sorangium atrum]|uniref:DUF4274 domain-containing protein n=1 Tax=Sorangium atrum TaxID=2995308 RepID=A0ABT5BUP9_9BACT|nr:hypothetical protein [Sorangium aterium]MDC0677878.1 hypothetical protein [Sorangium aterium]